MANVSAQISYGEGGWWASLSLDNALLLSISRIGFKGNATPIRRRQHRVSLAGRGMARRETPQAAQPSRRIPQPRSGSSDREGGEPHREAHVHGLDMFTGGGGGAPGTRGCRGWACTHPLPKRSEQHEIERKNSSGCKTANKAREPSLKERFRPHRFPCPSGAGK